MGVNAKGVKTSINAGLSKNFYAYVQESGKCSRDGGKAEQYCFTITNDVLWPEKKWKTTSSQKNAEDILRQPFDTCGADTSSGTQFVQMCCDNCTRKCSQAECLPAFCLPITPASDLKKRDVSSRQKELLEQKLVHLRKSLVIKSLSMQGDQKERKATILSCQSFFLEFTKIQIKQVLENCEYITSVANVTRCVKIWQSKHAKAIYNMFYEIFGTYIFDSDDSEDDDNGIMEWTNLLKDDSFQHAKLWQWLTRKP